MSERVQRDRQGAHALAGPAQRRVRIPRRRRFDERVQISQQRRIDRRRALAAPARSARPFRGERRIRAEFLQPALDRGARDSGGAFDQRDAPVPERARFGRRPQAPRSLGEQRCQRRMLRPERGHLHGETVPRRPRPYKPIYSVIV